LLTDPDLLLLDEPTNHLDIQAIEWLEAYLRDWAGAAVIVSHDRYFLDQVVDVIWEMTPALDVYRGNYSAYLQQREEHYTRALLEYQEQQEFIEKEEDYIRRNLAGQNTRQAQGRRKRLESLLVSARLTPPARQRRLYLQLGAVSRSGDLVLQTRQLAIGYEDEGRPLFHAPDIVLKRGECAAVMGPNGAGKTTFLKTILGQIPPYSGETILGAALQVGYFAQAHESLDPLHTLMEEIERAAPTMRPAEIRNYLAKFLFTEDDVFKTVSVLSGGERGRLALAVLALSSANLLLLDEPTNHLDLVSQEILQSVLDEYPGTILLVSHDRYLIDALASQIWEVIPEKGSLDVFEGTYSEYRINREQEAAANQAALVIERDTASTRQKASAVPKEEITRQTSRSSNKERARLMHIQQVEEQINQLESQLAAIGRSLENPPADSARVTRLSQDYQSVQNELEQRFAEWEILQNEGNGNH
jgi:ATP-binding cassette subfamily F protein 3